jgi:two-component system, chemotaxis family, chemotaxis protein CheY
MRCWLVVDDSDVIRKVARKVLEDMNFLVLEADSGAAAIEQCNRAMPEIILLDWLLPDMSGHELMTSIRAIDADRTPVIVYCTTDNEPQDLSRAFAAGAQTYLMKPFNRSMLQAKIAEAVRLVA